MSRHEIYKKLTENDKNRLALHKVNESLKYNDINNRDSEIVIEGETVVIDKMLLISYVKELTKIAETQVASLELELAREIKKTLRENYLYNLTKKGE